MGITLADVHLNWLNLLHFLILARGVLVILIDCIIFLSPFLDVTRMSMSTGFFLAQLDYGILNGFKITVNRHLLAGGSF